MLKVKLPDGKVLEYSHRVRPIDIAAEIGPRLAKATLAAEVDGQLVGTDTPLPEDGEIALRLITTKDPEALDVMRHSVRHIMARAVMRLFNGVQLAFGPTVDRRLLLRLSDGARALRERLPQDRGRDGQDRQGGRAVRADRDGPRTRPSRSAATWGKRSRSSTSKEGWPKRRPCRSIARASSSTCAAGRTCPAPGRSGRSSCSRWPAPIGRATPRGSNCSGSTAPPCSASRNWTTTCSRSKRPSAATTACWASNSNCSPIEPMVGRA